MSSETVFVEFDPGAPQQIRPVSISAPELLRLRLPRRERLLDPILPAKGLAMLYGPRGLGKTHVAMGIAQAVAAGGSFLKWRADEPRRVYYVDGEMPTADMQARLHRIGAAPPTLRFLLADMQEAPLPDLGNAEGQAALERWWDDQPDLLVIDNLSSLVTSARDNDAESWSAMQSWLLRLRRKGVSVLLVHHAGKGGQQRGTSRREDVLDMVLALRRPADYRPKDGARFEIHIEKARGLFGPATDPFEVHLQTDAGNAPVWSWRPVCDAEFDRAVELFADGVSASDAAEALGVSRATAYRLRKRAMAEGRVME
jgi:putative DNA primase/helicase